MEEEVYLVEIQKLRRRNNGFNSSHQSNKCIGSMKYTGCLFFILLFLLWTKDILLWRKEILLQKTSIVKHAMEITAVYKNISTGTGSNWTLITLKSSTFSNQSNLLRTLTTKASPIDFYNPKFHIIKASPSHTDLVDSVDVGVMFQDLTDHLGIPTLGSH